MPYLLYTDIDPAMIASINSSWLTTKHHFCIFHIRKNLEKHFMGKYHSEKWKKFFTVFCCARNSRIKPIFEERWTALITEYADAANYLQRYLYPCQEAWVLCFMHRAFNTGIQSTQRVESYNGIIKNHVSGSSSLIELEFVIERLLQRESRFISLNKTISKLPASQDEDYYNYYFKEVDVFCQNYLMPAILKLQRHKMNRSMHYRYQKAILTDELGKQTISDSPEGMFSEDMFDTYVIELDQLIRGLDLARIRELWHVSSIDRKSKHFIVLYDNAAHLFMEENPSFHHDPTVSAILGQEFGTVEVSDVNFSYLETIWDNYVFTKEVCEELSQKQQYRRGFGIMKKTLNLAIATGRVEELYEVHLKLIKDMEAEIVGQAKNGDIIKFASTISNLVLPEKKAGNCKGKKRMFDDDDKENSRKLQDFDRINADREGEKRTDQNDNNDANRIEMSESDQDDNNESPAELPHKKPRKTLHDVTNDLSNKRTCGICNEKEYNVRTCPQKKTEETITTRTDKNEDLYNKQVTIYQHLYQNETIVSDDFKSKRKRQKAIRRADQQRKRRKIQRTKKQKICIEKDVQAIEARIPREIALGTYLITKQSKFKRSAELISRLTPDDVKIAIEQIRNNQPIVNRAVLELTRNINVVGGKIMGSHQSRILLRSEIRAVIIRDGSPSLFITINPADLHSSIVMMYAGKEIDVNTLLPDDFPTATERAKLAHIDPTAVAKYFNVVIEKTIKFIIGYKKPEGGVFGEIKNYYAVTEYQDRGTPHCHMLIWLCGAPNSIELRDHLKSEDFGKQLMIYLNEIIKEDISYLFPNNKDFLTDEMLNIEYKTPKTSLEKKIHPSILPIPDPRSPNFDENFRLDVLRIAKCTLFHRCTKSCKKYYRGRTSNCRFDFPRELVEVPRKIYPELGIITLQRCNAYINNHNPYITASCHGNNDIRFIATVKLALAYIYYITNYITKTDASTHNSFLLCAMTLNKFVTKISDPNELSKEFVPRSRKLVTMYLNKIVGQTEMTGPQVSAYLLNIKDYYTPNKFVSIYLNSFETYLTSQYPIENLPESLLSDDSGTDSNEDELD
ncbi:hypothetical protein Glove_475g15 [Diversispora epigaea]|uniref:Helitron helicase-like domain-containing protein n=1 Tax=Diversispora epigaea TaxID=1348612 RepID=A0A397GQ99_9GLOM|nr:hypothetical protein Glove_475g15 [Diversispora epigaea]